MEARRRALLRRLSTLNACVFALKSLQKPMMFSPACVLVSQQVLQGDGVRCLAPGRARGPQAGRASPDRR